MSESSLKHVFECWYSSLCHFTNLVEKELVDVVGEESSELALLGLAWPHVHLYLLNESGQNSGDKHTHQNGKHTHQNGKHTHWQQQLWTEVNSPLRYLRCSETKAPDQQHSNFASVGSVSTRRARSPVGTHFEKLSVSLKVPLSTYSAPVELLSAINADLS